MRVTLDDASERTVSLTPGWASGVRRTQADRRATTRAALADAAIDLLIQQGWAALSAAEVCKRAEVTRGAFHHHYPNLPTLLADALRRLYAEMRRKDGPPASDLTTLIDATWAAIGNPRFKAVLEAWLAMANDPRLRAEIGPVVAEFSTLVSPDAMASTILTADEHRAFYLMARETMLGLALGRATNGGEPLAHEQAVLVRLRADASRI
ncbi:MAG TPA: TetR/AcrR family transcriptional regulator [Candidatus Binatia bacterium]|jgi:AcrR family transcriptional regulator|nr:TetR/AcrR family transcriptional regulator [Candidatus Binatia bacterium]